YSWDLVALRLIAHEPDWRSLRAHEFFQPLSDVVRELVEDLGVRAAALLEYVEAVVGVLDDLHRRPWAERFDDGREQRKIGERVARSLQEQHRLRHLGEVLGARGSGSSGRVQRETQEHEARDVLERLG